MIDRFNDLLVSGYVTPSGHAFLLLHGNRTEESIRAFFVEAHELFAKHVMNPFYKYDTPIVSSQFDFVLRALSKRYLALHV